MAITIYSPVFDHPDNDLEGKRLFNNELVKRRLITENEIRALRRNIASLVIYVSDQDGRDLRAIRAKYANLPIDPNAEEMWWCGSDALFIILNYVMELM